MPYSAQKVPNAYKFNSPVLMYEHTDFLYEYGKKGDRIDILPQWQDAGDENYVWVATDDEENGRVTICPISMPVSIKPSATVDVNMIMLREAGFVSSILTESAL